MTIYNVQEATNLFDSIGPKCDEEMVKQWIKDGKLKGIEDNGTYVIQRDDIEEFLYSYRWEGTAYEKGIDDQTKIHRLLEEIDDFRKENEQLWKKIMELEMKLDSLGVPPF